MNWKKILIYILAIFAIAAVITIIHNRERHYDWNIRYTSKSDQPYGLLLFDQLMKESMPKEYEVVHYLENKHKDFNLLVISSEFNLYEHNAIAIYDHLAAGNDVMIITEELNTHDSNPHYYNTDEMQDNDTSIQQKEKEDKKHYESIKKQLKALSYKICSTSDLRTPQELKNSPILQLHQPLSHDKGTKTLTARQGFCTAYFDETVSYASEDDGNWTFHNKYTIPAKPEYKTDIKAALSAHTKIGKGNLYVISAARCFTNAGILDDNTLHFVINTMDMIANKPVVRITNPYNIGNEPSEDENDQESGSIFRFFQQNKALNLMLYITLVGILLAIFFNARRRQRAINVRKTERNTTLAFIHQIASLYKNKSNYHQLYVNKLYAFAEFLRKKVGADIFSCTEKDIASIAQKTGLSQNDINAQIESLMKYYKNDKEKKMTFKDFNIAVNIIRNIKKKIVENR